MIVHHLGITMDQAVIEIRDTVVLFSIRTVTEAVMETAMENGNDAKLDTVVK